MFHSSGTASGKVEVMNRWNTTISTTAATVSHLYGENSSTSGVAISTEVPPACALRLASSAGRRPRGESREGARLLHLNGTDGPLLTIGGATARERRTRAARRPP